MTIELLLNVLGTHLAALNSPTWSKLGSSPGPALYLDASDTQALIAELTRLRPSPDAVRMLTGVQLPGPVLPPEAAGAR
jgi:hypothetical protein